MICPKCGSENKETAKFCNECGLCFAQDTEKVPDTDDQDTGQTSPRSQETLRFSSLPGIDPLDDFLEVNAIDDLPEADVDGLEFDFSPIGLPEEEGFADTRGIDEYLVSSEYRPPNTSWKTGTMEMPRVEGDEAPRKKEYRVSDAPAKKRGGKKAAVIAILAVLVLTLGAFGTTYYYELWGGKSLPDVVGLDQAEATKVLEAKHFVAKTMQVKSDDTEGIVLLMDPGAGKRLSQGSEVVLQVAVSRSIPEVLGLSREDAEKALSQEGFQKVTYVEEKSNEPEGTILSVEPGAGTKATASMPITVKVAQAYTVPEVVGTDQASAVQILSDAGYEAYSVWVYSEEPEGIVIGSDPVAGEKLASGSTVTIQIAKSRATELVNATYSFLGGYVGSTLEIGGTAYELISVDGANYEGGNKTTATITVVGVTTLPDGEVVRGAQKQRVITLAWNDDNTINSYA